MLDWVIKNLIKLKSQHSYTIEDMQSLAEMHGGKCISRKYRGLVRKLKWKCKDGHAFEAMPSIIKHHNQWCPECTKVKGS